MLSADIAGWCLLAADFPTKAPFRVDQVIAAPLLMGALAVGQVGMAAGLDIGARQGWHGLWRSCAGLFLVLTLVFFTLGTWGTSDTTKINFALTLDRSGGTVGEPLWWLIGPGVILLPYRMALVHGLVASGYAATVMALARLWSVPAWAGWWAVLLTWSPFLRSFLQNGITRQALSTLLLLPLFLRLAGLQPVRKLWVALGVVGAALSHTTFPFSFGLALSPLLVGTGASRLGAAVRRLRRRWLWLLLPLVVLVLGMVVPVTLSKLAIYANKGKYYSSYSLLPEVRRLQMAMALGLVGACWQHRLGPSRLLQCPISRLLLLFAGLYGVLQWMVARAWLAAIAFRLSDAAGFFLLILFLAWLVRYRSLPWLWPALLVTMHAWLFQRVLPSGQLACGSDDSFLCIPDRWPWQVRY